MPDTVIRLSRPEYWLLESVVELRQTIAAVFGSDVDEYLNKCAPKCADEVLIGSMCELGARGWLIGTSTSRGDFELRETDVRAALTRDVRRIEDVSFFGLTAAGGSAWEAFAAPDWDRRIVDECGELEDDGRCQAECTGGNERRIRRYVDGTYVATGRVSSDDLEWTVVEPFEATYWRSLPIGYRVRFRCRPRAPGSDTPAPDESELLAWAASASRWYQWG